MSNLIAILNGGGNLDVSPTIHVQASTCDHQVRHVVSLIRDMTEKGRVPTVFVYTVLFVILMDIDLPDFNGHIHRV